MQYNKELIQKIIPTLSFQFPYELDDFAENFYFENYHKHTCESNYGLADSGETYDAYVEQIKAVKSQCLFSGEHGWQGDHIAVYDLAQNVGLKYRHSSEVYWVKDRHEPDRTNCHMVIVAKTAKGRKKLNYILSKANEDGFYGRPRIDLDLLLSVDKDDFIVTSACFKKGTKVTTDGGLKSIETILPHDKVLNRFGKWETINHLTKIDYNGIGYHIKTNAFDEDVICTEDHKFLTTSINNMRKSPKWVSANELRIKNVSPNTKDKLLHPLVTEFNGKSIINKSDFDGAYKKVSHSWSVKQKMNDVVELTPEMMRLLGVFIGDGSIDVGHKNDRICFTLNLEDYYYFRDDFISSVENQIGIKFNVLIREKNHRVDLSTSSIDFINFIYYLFGNCKASTKHIPERLKHISYGLDCELIYGLIISDGYIRKNIRDGYESGEMVLATISSRLCSDFRRLCSDIGCLVSKSIADEHTDKNGVHHNTSYYLTMSSKEILKINKKQHISHLDVVHTFKHFYDNMRRNPRRLIGDQEYLVVTIREMNMVNLQETVYCLNNDSHSFVAGGCIVHNCIAGWKYDDADKIWLKIARHFQENFFFEVQYHDTDEQKTLNKHILELADKHNISIIAGLDSHYINDEGRIKRDMILKYKNIQYPDEQGWYMDFPTADVIIQRFQNQGVLSEEQIYAALMNTNIFVNDCEEIQLDKSFKIPNIYRNEDYSQRVKRYQKLLNDAYKKEPCKSPERVKGIKEEAHEVISSGVVDYFLFNHALIERAIQHYNGTLTTTSRGSMGSYYTNKLLGYTTLDRFSAEIPIYPSRFLSADRVLAGQMPDCDYNLANQEPFIRAAKDLVGEHGCYPLMAIEKLKVKSAWQLYSKANGVTSDEAIAMSKAIEQYELKLKHTNDEDKDQVHIEDFIPSQYLGIYQKSISYQKITINLKVHACGYLVFDGDIREEVGLVSAVSETTGKRTLCACVQGGYLDSHGYVKDDFLIVDSVSLTAELFKSIGKPVPSFEELKEMVKGDALTWDIYAKGCTCCVNQLEKEATIKKMQKYKATNIEELSSFIAAIRPGFAPLLHTFLDRQPYSTGETEIDNLLQDTAHFMLYQESIMKVLSFLNIPIGDTYGVIKSISKKKLVGEKKEKLKKTLETNWKAHFGNTNNFDKVWAVIESSALYAFNSPHAYSMSGDSLYQAWFKAHHTSKFYEVAIAHYQKKNDKDKIRALLDEAVKSFGYIRLPYKFRQDNRKVTVNDTNKTITPNLSAVKGLGEKVVSALYENREQEYDSFVELLEKSSLQKNHLIPLIKLRYFSEFGKSQYLLNIYDLYCKYHGKKIIKKDQCEFPREFMLQFATETDKQYKLTDSEGFLKALCNQVPNRSIPIKDYLDAQNEYLGYIDYVNPKAKEYGYVMNIDTKYSPKLTIYELDTGKTVVYKMPKKIFATSGIEKGSILKFTYEVKARTTMVDGEWKKDFSVKEPWINKFMVKSEV